MFAWFSDDVTVQFHLDKYTSKLDVMKAINDIEYVYGFTNRADALRIMRTDMFSPRNGNRPDKQVRTASLPSQQMHMGAAQREPEGERQTERDRQREKERNKERKK